VKPKLLIVDDDESIRKQMRWALQDDYEVLMAQDRMTAVGMVRSERPQIVTLDLGLPPAPWEASEGLKSLEEIMAEDRTVKVIVITGNTDRINALRAISSGAFDFYCKPVDISELQVVLKRALYLGEIAREQMGQAAKDPVYDGMVGASPSMEKVFSAIRKVAASDFPVLILGESGTGKELAARAIHALSVRNEGPFVPINCAAIPRDLIESELFGHEKGSFTGAHAQRKGRIEYAEKGTLFLDEIAELDLPLQVKLLRFLQEQTLERVGGRDPIRIDVRIIAATNRDLEKEVADGRFREDLFYRINVVKIELPPLRDRGGDVLLMARRFIEQFSIQAKKKIKGFSASANEALIRHGWPGNVRELENRIRRAVIMSEGEFISAADLDLAEPADVGKTISLREARDRIDREMVIRALAENHGNVKEAAAHLGISRQTLYDLLAKHSIQL
jgi:two-component system NtrC family response regulator